MANEHGVRLPIAFANSRSNFDDFRHTVAGMPSNSRHAIRTGDGAYLRERDRSARKISYVVSLSLRARDIDNYFSSPVEKSVAVTLIIIQSFALATDIAELRKYDSRAREI